MKDILTFFLLLEYFSFGISIRLSETCLSFTDTSYTTMHLYTNVKPNLSNVVIFVLTEEN